MKTKKIGHICLLWNEILMGRIQANGQLTLYPSNPKTNMYCN